MSTSVDLYGILGVSKEATSEEVRKAYRRKALQTHPDRLPQNASSSEKKAAEEQFRLVNNAYEVLNNSDNRKLYDKHGVWPPPTEQPDVNRNPTRDSFWFSQNPFVNDPFFSAHLGFGSGSRGPQFAFTDPFELFNSLFGDLHTASQNDSSFTNTPFTRSPFDAPFFRTPFPSPFGGMGDPFTRTPFGGSLTRPFGRSMFGGSPFDTFFTTPTFDSSNARIYRSTMQSVGGSDGRFISRSHTSRTINGRTESITKRIDVDGNEHITYSSPDGERYTINGVEQPRGAIDTPHHSNTAPSFRQPTPAIADRPAEPPANVASPLPVQAFNVPISGSHHDSHAHAVQPIVPPVPTSHHQRRSSRHSYRGRERAVTEDHHRGHTVPIVTPTPSVHRERRDSNQMDVDPPMPGEYLSKDRDHDRRSLRHGNDTRDRDRDAASPTSTGSRRGGWRGW